MLNKLLKKPVLNINNKPFKSRIEPAIWKKMSQEQRNAHKVRQAAFRKSKLKNKVKLILNKYPRGYFTVYRKTSKCRAPVIIKNSRVVKIIKKSLKVNSYHNKKTKTAHEIYAWKQILAVRGFKIANRIKNYRLFGVFNFLNRTEKNNITPVTRSISVDKQTNKLLYWNSYLPVYYCYPIAGRNSVVNMGNYVYIFNQLGSVQINKNEYGSLLVLHNELALNIKNNVSEYEILQSIYDNSLNITRNTLKENSVIKLYSALIKQRSITLPAVASIKARFSKTQNLALEKRGYIKHVVRMRYRWFFQPKLSQFKLFKKFFKRSLKRYRKINKNKLFVSKFRSHFPKLTGFTEKGLLQMWLPFRRNYNQYWSASNAVSRFSQSLLLTTASFLVFLQLAPSFAASKYIIKSGAISINGLAITSFTEFKPSDIMQLNVVIWKSVRNFFDYQRWNSDFRPLQQVPFLQVDWSSLMFMMIRWPRKYELVAPSFLSERWVRYYIRQFPSKVRRFKKSNGNWKVYKRIITKR